MAIQCGVLWRSGENIRCLSLSGCFASVIDLPVRTLTEGVPGEVRDPIPRPRRALPPLPVAGETRVRGNVQASERDVY